MQYIGVLSVIPTDELKIGVVYIQKKELQEEHGLHDLSLKCGIFMIFLSTIFGDEQITIWNAIIVTSINSLRIPIQIYLLLLLGFKRLNLMRLCEQETCTLVRRYFNLMALALKSQLFKMDAQLIKKNYRVE
ncbi:hypothetical protein MXB_5624, partial [Myxobolus squamalis]